jgi:hypothetical protein
MNKAAQSDYISFDFRSARLARVSLAVGKTDSKAQGQNCHQRKPIAADLNRRPLTILSSATRHARPARAMIQSP